MPNTNRIIGPIHKKPPTHDKHAADHAKAASVRKGTPNTNVSKRVP